MEDLMILLDHQDYIPENLKMALLD